MTVRFFLKDKILDARKLFCFILYFFVLFQLNSYAESLFSQLTTDEFVACGYDNEEDFMANLAVCLQIRDKTFRSGVCNDSNCLIARPEHIEENCDKNYDAFYYLVLISSKKQEMQSKPSGKPLSETDSNKPAPPKSVASDDYKKGLMAFDKEDYDTAYALLKNYNYSVVKPLMGYMYLFGLGGEQDLEKAAILYLETAKEGSSDAREIAAILYDKDYVAEGENEVITNPQDHVFNKRRIFSQNKIIDIGYEKGIQAFKDQRYITAYKILRNYNVSDFPEANPMSGLLTMFGYNTEKNIATGFELFLDAAKQGHSDAQMIIALTYFNGEGDFVPQDFNEAGKWLLKAAESGYPYAQRKLGDIYVLGLGVKPDFDRAKRWYSKAAENGDETAKKYLGILETDGLPSCARVLAADSYMEKF